MLQGVQGKGDIGSVLHTEIHVYDKQIEEYLIKFNDSDLYFMLRHKQGSHSRADMGPCGTARGPVTDIFLYAAMRTAYRGQNSKLSAVLLIRHPSNGGL